MAYDYHGIKVVDNYRWMEDPSDAEWLPTLRAQNARTRSILDAIPGRAKLARRISELSAESPTTKAVKTAGTSLFYEQRPTGADNFKLFVRLSSNTVRALVDPTTMKAGEAHFSLG